MEQNIEVNPENVVGPPWYRKNKRFSLIAIIIAFLMLILATGVLFVQNRGGDKKSPTQSDEVLPLANNTIVYGFWSSGTSVIEAYDLSTRKKLRIATLPHNVKHIKVLDQNSIIYIANTNEHDYGDSLIIRNIENDNEKVVLQADTGFGIDDYVISSDRKSAAVWKVGLSNDDIFVGGKSKVYSVDLNNLNKNLIVNETASNNQPVLYPVAITNDKKIIMDKFKPNSGAGWGYGLSISNFDGTNLEEIDVMKNGTYGTQPTLSRDGKFLAFASYSKSDGASEIDGFRKALIGSDGLALLDTSSLERISLPTNTNDAIISRVKWDSSENTIYFTAVRNENGVAVNSNYNYDIVSKTSQEAFEKDPYENYSVLSGNSSLLVQRNSDDSTIGNLGSKYAQAISKIAVLNNINRELTEIPMGQPQIQLIDVLPSSYFPVLDSRGEESSSLSEKQLQLTTLEIKPSLAPKRLQQQSEPPPVIPVPNQPAPDLPLCRTITYPQCNQLLGKNYPLDKDIGDLNDPAFSDCVWKFQQQGEASSTCLDSPLYLYGPDGSEVTISIGTEILNPNIPGLQNVFSAKFDSLGKIALNGSIYESIDFNYVSKVRKITPPKEGFVINKSDIETSMEDIGKRMNLNDKEIKDTVEFIQEIDSPYLFISWFDHKLSHSILPLHFDPVPDNYRNIVFYVEKLKSIERNVSEPAIVPIRRNGVTAIEISFIVR